MAQINQMFIILVLILILILAAAATMEIMIGVNSQAKNVTGANESLPLGL